jgi:hypothetical protein
MKGSNNTAQLSFGRDGGSDTRQRIDGSVPEIGPRGTSENSSVASLMDTVVVEQAKKVFLINKSAHFIVGSGICYAQTYIS